MTNYLMGFTKKRDVYSGRGYIAGQAPGIVSVDGLPAKRPVELRVRDGDRRLVSRIYSNSSDGTYRFNDLDPYTSFDIVSRDEPNYVYNDVIIGSVWPWTDNEIILHGIAAPRFFDYSFTRTYTISGGTLPYSISGTSTIPSGVVVTLSGTSLTIQSTTDPGSNLSLVIADSASHTVTVSITSRAALPYATARAFRIYIPQRSNSGTGTTAAGYMNLSMGLAATPGGINLCNQPGTNNPVDGATGGQSSVYSGGPSYTGLLGFQYPRGSGGGLWHSDNQGAPWWAYFDFGAGNEKTVQELFVIAQNTQPDQRTPYELYLQTSDDLSTWTDVHHSTGITGWTIGVEKTFSIHA